jgi:hypothetical protein
MYEIQHKGEKMIINAVEWEERIGRMMIDLRLVKNTLKMICQTRLGHALPCLSFTTLTALLVPIYLTQRIPYEVRIVAADGRTSNLKHAIS